MGPEVVMSATRVLVCVAVTSACLNGSTVVTAAPEAARLAQAPAAATRRTPLGIVHKAPVEVPAGLDARLGRVLVQLDADVAADGAVADVHLISVGVIANKVEMT